MPNGISTGWVDTASKVIVQVGFPVVVAGVLLWFLLTKFQDNMNIITDRMSKNTEVAAELIKGEQKTFMEMEAQTRLLGQLVTLRKDELETLKRTEHAR
jgi:hypothetical protein